MTRRLVIVLAAVLHAGCAPAGAPDAGPPVVASAPYYPLEVGTRWRYRAEDHELDVRVVRHETVARTACALLETYRDGERVAREHVFATKDGVYRLSADGKTMTPPLPLLKLPPKKGLRWTVTFEHQVPPLHGTFVMNAEELEIRYRGFAAGAAEVRQRKLTVTLQGEIREGHAPHVAFKYWYAWQVGIVKQELRVKDKTVVYGLVKFEKG